MHTNTVLIVEDSQTLAQTYVEYLKDEYNVAVVYNGADAVAFIHEKMPNVVLLDLLLPDMNGMDILKEINSNQTSTRVIVNTAEDSVDVAVEAMRLNAFDFMVKPFNASRLRVTIKNALEQNGNPNKSDVPKNNVDSKDDFCKFIGSSAVMEKTYRIIECAAPSNATVFISGESGTGKELCAEAIHELSPRSKKPFVTINCAAIPKDLIESEIFGHVKGSFTGASTDRTGAAQRADGGTLFLDEICEMSYSLQSKLLRFIQSGTFQKVGSNTVEKVDVRFICATNRNIYKEVEKGRFREDLFFRLHVIPVQLPALRDRDKDIISIAKKYLSLYAAEENKIFKEFNSDVEIALLNYYWPGNVRELQNVIRNIVVLNNKETVTLDMLPEPLNTNNYSTKSASTEHQHNIYTLYKQQNQVPIENEENESDYSDEIRDLLNDNDDLLPLWKIELQAIEDAIERCKGNIPKAAALLDVSASTIYRKRQTWKEEGKL